MSTTHTATYSTGEAAELLDVAEPTIYRYLKRGWLRAVRDDGSYAAALRITAESLQAFVSAANDAARLSCDTSIAAEILLTGRRTVQRLVRQGILERYPAPGHGFRVSMASVEALCQRLREDDAA
jgi:excisionase family DNA binding protein